MSGSNQMSGKVSLSPQVSQLEHILRSLGKLGPEMGHEPGTLDVYRSLVIRDNDDAASTEVYPPMISSDGAEGREAVEDLCYLHDLLPHYSLFMPPENDHWVLVYLHLLSDDLSPSLVTLLHFLRALALPQDYSNLILMDLLLGGEESLSAAYLREAIVNCYSMLLQNEIATVQGAGSDTVDTRPIAGPIKNALAMDLTHLLGALGERTATVEEKLYRWSSPLRIRRDSVLMRDILTREKAESLAVAWESIVAIHGYVDMSTPSEPPQETWRIVSAVKRGRGDGAPMSVDLHRYSRELQRWGEELAAMSTRERDSVALLLEQFSDEFTVQEQSPSFRSMLLDLYGAQELVTPRRLLEFATLVEEYNMEWAIASFEWIREGEESHVMSTLRRALRDSPWSDTPHR